jgi:hypothetical protein
MTVLQRRLVVCGALFLLAIGLLAAQTETVYVTRTGSKYHRDGCSSLSRSKIPMSLAEAARRYGPCANCRPPVPGATAGPHSAAPLTHFAEPSAISASTPVLVTRTGQKYHRAGCRTLGTGGIPSTLGEASKKFGPCGICAPPVLGTAAPARLPAVEAPPPPAPAARSGRCQAITKKGTQCSRNARAGSSYCWQHGG